MPRREDEYWAERREASGKALCPACGSTKVYFNKTYGTWRCGRCEKSFPSPSYGGAAPPRRSWWQRLFGRG